MAGEAVRKFGVELEGYLNEDLEGESFYVNGYDFDIKEDGSLGSDDDDEEDCEDCNGSGHTYPSCSNTDCNEGTVYWTDSDGNEYEDDCKSCGGTGEGESEECESCDGEGTISAGNGRYGLEIVSPPITDLSLINGVYRRMEAKGWRVDEEAGLHIHVDASDLTPKDFYKILLLMTAVEPIIYTVNDAYRFDGSGYCYPISNWETVNAAQHMLERGIDNMDGWSDVMFSNDRYTAMNFTAYRKHSTIEFRYFSPQEEAQPVINFVELVTRLVEFCKHATLEQLFPIYKEIFETTDFNHACDVLREALDLPFDLKIMKQNNLFNRIERVKPEWKSEEVEEAV